jgi:PIN domain nuclease of toxin-antitoxin system
VTFLLDTHAFLWFASGDEKLPIHIQDTIKNLKNSCFVSVASMWEISIKQRLGKLNSTLSIDKLFKLAEKNQIEILQISSEHLMKLSKLPLHHNDPFDRLIISQSIAEKLILISKDNALKSYPVKLSW